MGSADSRTASGSLLLAKATPAQRPRIAGKFLAIGAKKFYVKGVSYGAFEPDEDGREYHDLDQVDRDFAQMAAAGFNTVRIPHTMPPRALLDIAQRHGLMVMVGLSAEQYVGFLIDRSKKAPDVIGMVREKIRTVAGHPALLCYGIGNEIPAAVARWIGRKRIQRYLHAIYRAVKREDPEGLVTYVNYPTTEYLQLPFLDFVSFNIYLEDREKFRKYLARVQNIAGDRPLLMSEVGLDAMRNGEEKQADVLEWQIRIAFAAGCAGAVVFSWTDEWFRGGGAVDDWEFGLTRRSREPKSSLYAVSDAFAESPFKDYLLNPRFSVIVCTFNGSETIGETLEGLQKLDYPDFEIIVVDDGSADDTVQIVEGFDGVRLITIANGGLSGARNVDLRAATGEFVAYIDDDAWPDPHWLQYLAHAFLASSHAGIGGPNLSPSDDSWKAQCVAKSPGGPLHVLTSDDTAEHIPGCNMAFRKADLVAIGGFDLTFVVAGDDVDVCWRLQEQGHTLGFHAGAMVWHRRRASSRRYLRQQAGYGRAEAMLETKWPAKYNSVGHISWQGKVYGPGLTYILGRVSRVYHGPWGSAPFQALEESPASLFFSASAMPEWWILVVGLAALAGLGVFWAPILWVAVPGFAVALGLVVVQNALSVRDATIVGLNTRGRSGLATRATIFALHHLQPLARLWGRCRGGLIA